LKKCHKCNKETIQGHVYTDEETNLLCVHLEKKIDLPKNKIVLVPQICENCGHTEWLSISTFED